MTNKFIHDILEREGENPVLLTDCVLTISGKRERQLIIGIYGETDFKVKYLDICYADNHENIIDEFPVITEHEIELLILNHLKI